MTKMLYYLCVDKNDKNLLLYGGSKKEIHKIGEKMKIGPLKSVTEQKLPELRKTYEIDALSKVREVSKAAKA